MNRRLVLFSLALHMVGLVGIVLLTGLQPRVWQFGGPDSPIDMRFAPRPSGGPRGGAAGGGAKAVSRETPKPTPRKEASAPKPKTTPKPESKTQAMATPKPTPKAEAAKKTVAKATPKPKATPRPQDDSKRKVTVPKKEEKKEEKTEVAKEEKPEATAAPQPTRTYYPQPPAEEKAETASRSAGEGSKAGSRENTGGNAANGTGGPLTPGGGGSGTKGAMIGVRGGGPSLPEYYSRQAIASIASHFKVAAEQESDATCEIAFFILKDGQIKSPRTLQSSGDPALDSLALEALTNTSRLAPLPDELQASQIEAQLTFSFRSESGAR